VRGKQASQLFWLVFLHEVPGAGQQLQVGARYASGELAATLRRNPREARVVAAGARATIYSGAGVFAPERRFLGANSR
jgi:hypothetical protein